KSKSPTIPIESCALSSPCMVNHAHSKLIASVRISSSQHMRPISSQALSNARTAAERSDIAISRLTHATRKNLNIFSTLRSLNTQRSSTQTLYPQTRSTLNPQTRKPSNTQTLKHSNTQTLNPQMLKNAKVQAASRRWL